MEHREAEEELEKVQVLQFFVADDIVSVVSLMDFFCFLCLLSSLL